MSKEQRFNELFVKDCRGLTTEEEKSDLVILESSRISEIEAEKNHLVGPLDEAIRQLKELLSQGNAQ